MGPGSANAWGDCLNADGCGVPDVMEITTPSLISVLDGHFVIQSSRLNHNRNSSMRPYEEVLL